MVSVKEDNKKSKVNKKAKEDKVPPYLRVSPTSNVIITALFAILAVVFIAPLVFVAMISISSDTSIANVGYSFFPESFSFRAYEYLWNNKGLIGGAFIVSIVVTLVGTAVGLLLNATMAYVLSRRQYKLRKFYTWLIFIPMLFQGGMVSTYLVVTQFLQLKDSLLALILPLAVSSFYIIVMRTFFQTTVPDSVIESAKMDGANQLFIFFRIVVPISLPAIATIGLFLTFAYWNDWFQAMLYISSQRTDLFPLQYVLISIERNIDFLTRNAQAIGGMSDLLSRMPTETMRMAIVIVVVLPIACSYPFFQRFFISGLTIGAVKG